MILTFVNQRKWRSSFGSKRWAWCPLISSSRKFGIGEGESCMLLVSRGGGACNNAHRISEVKEPSRVHVHERRFVQFRNP